MSIQVVTSGDVLGGGVCTQAALWGGCSMGYPIHLDAADFPLLFLMIDSSNHRDGKTGLVAGTSLTVTLRKPGGSFAAPHGGNAAITEVGNGWYQVAPDANDSDTEGPLLLHATGTGSDPTDETYFVQLSPIQLWELFVKRGMENLANQGDLEACSLGELALAATNSLMQAGVFKILKTDGTLLRSRNYNSSPSTAMTTGVLLP